MNNILNENNYIYINIDDNYKTRDTCITCKDEDYKILYPIVNIEKKYIFEICNDCFNNKKYLNKKLWGFLYE